MKKIIKYIGLLFSFLVMFASCQKLEDTYKDYIGNGEIRYLGQCSNVSVSPGWKRLILNWTNSVDPVVDKIKVEWKVNGSEKYVLLDKKTTEYSISNLEDGIYTISISSLDKDGNPSLETTVYGRPYTSAHEQVQSFTRLISKHYVIGSRLILFFEGWQDGIVSSTLKYTDKDGTADSLIITKDLVDSKYYLLPNEIDVSKDLVLYRTGRIPGCEDLIVFDPYILPKDKVYSADFKDILKTKYGTNSNVLNASGDVLDSWANSVTELDIDASLNSFEDILNLPNLQKLVLGKHRYLLDDAISTQKGQFQVYDTSCSNFVLNVAHSLLGLSVERYNKHYSTLSSNFIVNMGKPDMPVYNYYNLSDAKFTLIPADADDYDSHVEYLVDGDVNSCWQPMPLQSSTEYSIILDLKSVKHLSGLKFVQKHFGKYDQDSDLAPNLVQIKTSDSMIMWEDATYVEDNILGTSTGETNIIPFVAGGKDARYVKLILNTQYYHSFYNLIFAEIGLY